MIWIDLVIVGALLLGLGLGAKRGFLQTLGGVAATVVSFIGAGIAAGALSVFTVFILNLLLFATGLLNFII